MSRHIIKAIFLLALFTPTVSADPITLSGSITLVNGPNPANPIRSEPFVLTGTNFTANITTVSVGSANTLCGIQPIGAQPPCSSGSLGWQATGTDISGTFTLNGETSSSGLITPLGFTFTAPAFVIPPELLNASAVQVIAPFSFSGVAITSAQIATLTGEGTVTFSLTHQTFGDLSGLYLDRAIYTFGPVAEDVTIQAVPEPVTLLLFGSGLAGLALLKRKR